MYKILFAIFLINHTSNTFSQEKVTIKRFNIIYSFTNIDRISEVYIDHQKKQYLTNNYFIHSSSNSIIHLQNTTTVQLSKKPKYTSLSNFTKTTCKYISKEIESISKNYRHRVMKLHNLSLPNDKYSFQTNGNKIVRGIWYDHYTDTYTANPSDLDIDHIISIKEVFCKNYMNWTLIQFEKYINSYTLATLIPANLNENRYKKNSSPTYLPPNPHFQPIFIDMKKLTSKIYNF